ncbi:MAG: hypothetical protein VB876_15505, partial [Pirellulales bacterium]
SPRVFIDTKVSERRARVFIDTKVPKRRDGTARESSEGTKNVWLLGISGVDDVTGPRVGPWPDKLIDDYRQGKP